MRGMRVMVASVVAVVSVSVALAGCASTGSSGGTDAGAKQTINVWGWSGAPGAATMNEVISAFEKVNPNITVKYNEIVNTDYANKLTLALSSGQPIDVAGVFPNALTAQLGKYLVPVKDWPGESGLLDKFQSQAIAQEKKLSGDGVVRLVPLDSNGSAVGFYNVDLLKKAGFSKPPQTWDEMKQFSQALAKVAPGVAPAIIPSDNWFQNDFLMTLVGQNDPQLWNNMLYKKGTNFDTPALQDALTQYQELYASGTLEKSTVDVKYADAMSAFSQGKTAIVFTGTWESGLLLKSYRDTNKVQASDVGVMAVPGKDASVLGARAFLDTTYGIPEKSSHKAAAAKFLDFLTVGAGVNVWGPTLVGIPAVDGWKLPAGVLSSSVESDSYAEIQKLIANARGDRTGADAFQNQVGTYALQVASGSLSPTDAAKQAEADWTSGKFN
jgi:raffinose/stachyose/melibiose transport system substrate-binding protein